jgi:hypothetical protein
MSSRLYSFLLLAINMQKIQIAFHSGPWRAVCASEGKERRSRRRSEPPGHRRPYSDCEVLPLAETWLCWPDARSRHFLCFEVLCPS